MLHRRRQFGVEKRQQLLDGVGDFDGVGAGLALDGQNDGPRLLHLSCVEPGGGLVVLHAVDDACPAPPGAPASRCGRPRSAAGTASAVINCPVACRVKARCGPMMVPVGRLTFQFLSAVSTSLMPICREASACGSICTCTAYFCAPSTCTWATPLIIEMRCAMRVSAYSSRVQSGSVGEVRARYRIGWSAGLTLVKVGGVGMPWGSRREAWVMAACTSTAAPSRFRFRSNSRVIWVLPSEFERGHRIQAGDGRELVLERRGHGRGHGLGAGAGKSGGDQQGGEVDVGQIADGERAVGHACRTERWPPSAGWWRWAVR